MSNKNLCGGYRRASEESVEDSQRGPKQKDASSVETDVETIAEKKLSRDPKNGEYLLRHLREIRLARLSRSSASLPSSLTDQRIPMDEFAKSIRVLDTTRNVAPSSKIQKNPPSRSGLVPFTLFQSMSKDDKPEERRHSVTHLSFDEDNEEDMFDEAKDQDVKDTKEPLGAAHEIALSFHGFSSSESQQSRDAATRCCERQVLEKADERDVEEQAFRGFTRDEKDQNVDAVKKWYQWHNKYKEAVAGEISTKIGEKKSDRRVSVLGDPPCIGQLKNAKLLKPREKEQLKLAREATKQPPTSSSKVVQRIKNDAEMVRYPDLVSGMAIDSSVCHGFSTASGRKIVVSEAAIARATKLYQQVELDLERETKSRGTIETSSEEINPVNKSASSRAIVSGGEFEGLNRRMARSPSLFDESEDEIIEKLIEPNHPVESATNNTLREKNEGADAIANDRYIRSGFTTARGGLLKIPQEALSQAQSRFDEIDIQLDEKVSEKSVEIDAKYEKKDIGFKTAAGRQIKISQEALSKAKAQFDEIASQLNETTVVTDSSARSEGTEDRVDSNSTTAVKGHLKMSKVAISKAKSSELDGTLTPKNSRLGIGEREQVASSGFTSAAGRQLKISKEALSRAQAQFEDVENEIVKYFSQMDSKLDTPVIGSVWPRVQIRASSTAARTPLVEKHSAVESCNLESLEFEDFAMDESEDVTKKRKFEDIDEDTPMRRDPSWKRKKSRYVSELQGRKLFDEDAAIIGVIGKSVSTLPTKTCSSMIEPKKSHVSDEIDASAAALMEDEERSQDIIQKLQPDPVTRDDVTEMEIEALEKTENLSNRHFSSVSKNANIRSEGRSAGEYNAESIPDDLTFDSQFSQDHQQSQVINKFIAETMKIMEARLAMTSKQEETIRAKRRSKPRALDGSLYRLRISKRDERHSWREMTEGEPPLPREHFGTSVDPEVLAITSNSAAFYSFRCADFYGGRDVRINVEGIKVGDGAFLILDERNCAGVREFERAFLASPGVDPNLVPAGWVKNHYRWIVWKLASMDRVRFGHKCLPRMLKPNRVMLELKYRYDRELYRTQWPPLRRILEKNEDAGSRLVLCVASVTLQDDERTPVRGSSNTPSILFASKMYKIRLTDGWYDIPASIDAAMINCIKSGKIKEGTKIVTVGAKAMNLDQGCSVLEIPECVTLRIHTNSTRRARWDAKLDFCRSHRGPMSLSLGSVKSNGGAICKLTVAVARSYPILYREKLSDGQFVFRNARCDEEAARAHEARCQAKMEEICEKVQADFQYGTENCDLQEEEIRRAIASKLKECLPPARDVTPVLKVRVADGDTSATMTIWSTGRETDEVFEEGSTLVIYNCFASGQRCNELQITAGRNTILSRDTSRRIAYPERRHTSLMSIGEAGFNPVYSEFDTVGIVSSIGPAPHGMKNFETVNIACPRFEDSETSDFLSVLFWQGVSTHGYSKILTVGTPIACSNLEWRRNTSRSVPTAYCTERSIFSKNPRQRHLAKPFEKLRELVKDPLAYAANCATLIREEVARKTPLRTPGSGTPCRGLTNNATTDWSPRELAGSSFIDTDSTPKNNSRKASIMRRIEKLEAYGEAPKLPSISLNHSSPKVLSDFRSPLITPVTKS